MINENVKADPLDVGRRLLAEWIVDSAKPDAGMHLDPVLLTAIVELIDRVRALEARSGGA